MWKTRSHLILRRRCRHSRSREPPISVHQLKSDLQSPFLYHILPLTFLFFPLSCVGMRLVVSFASFDPRGGFWTMRGPKWRVVGGADTVVFLFALLIPLINTHTHSDWIYAFCARILSEITPFEVKTLKLPSHEHKLFQSIFNRKNVFLANALYFVHTQTFCLSLLNSPLLPLFGFIPSITTTTTSSSSFTQL